MGQSATSGRKGALVPPRLIGGGLPLANIRVSLDVDLNDTHSTTASQKSVQVLTAQPLLPTINYRRLFALGGSMDVIQLVQRQSLHQSYIKTILTLKQITNPRNS